MEKNRDSFVSQRGFIIACIGSSVGMGNIWLFPTRVSALGGAAFLIPYFVCVLFIGFTGVIGEMAFGRAMKSGPMGAFGKAFRRAGKPEAAGQALALIPIITSLALAIGYSVIVGWILKYTFGSITGAALSPEALEGFGAAFDAVASKNYFWHIIGLVCCFAIMSFGISRGIEKLNSIIMPLFFVLFIGIAVYIAFLPGAMDGYRFMFTPDWSSILSPRTWMYALGQSFFSLSLAGSGTLVYGSYLKDDNNIPSSARYVAVFDTLAGILAALAIIPAMATAGQSLTGGGPGLMFVYLPNIFAQMPGGSIVCIVFFVAALFAGMSSLVNLFESPVETLQSKFGLSRNKAVSIIAVIGIVVSLIISGIVEGWMDICTVYLCPVGALLAAVMFFWLCGKDFVTEAVERGTGKSLSPIFYPLGKYVFCGLTLLVLVLGITFGSIG